MGFILKSDMDYIEYLKDSIGDTGNGVRFYNLCSWYAKMADSCRIKYYILSAITLCIPPLILVANASSELLHHDDVLHMIVALLSGLATIVGGILSMGKFHENWIRYRTCTELMKAEATKYINAAAPYNVKKERDSLFSSNMEQIAMSESNSWKQDEQQKTKQDNQEQDDKDESKIDIS